MRTGVAVALSGVLVLAFMRAGTFIAPATGATVVTWVPIPALSWLTLNRTGLFRFKATRVGDETALAQIIRMVEDAQGSTVPIQRIADQVTGYFVSSIVTVVVLAFAGGWMAGNSPQGLLAFVAVLIIACPVRRASPRRRR